MASDVIGEGGRDGDVQVDVGGGLTVSMQTVQQIYNEITGRTERLSRTFSENHLTTFEDLQQLDVKIQQVCDQFHIVSKNTAVTLFHVDDQKQTFSSFERFRLFDQTTLSPIENIQLEYNFLIILPQAKKPQSYKIEINIHSRAAIQQRAEQEQGIHRRFLLDMVAEKTAHLEIEYVDYTVARTFQGVIDGWFKGLRQSKQNKAVRWVKKYTEHFPFAFRLISASVIFLVCIWHYREVLSVPKLDMRMFYMAATVTFGGLFFVNTVAQKLGSICESAVSRLRPISYIKLTRGDEMTIDRQQERCRKDKIVATASAGSTIVLNLLSTWLAIKLGIN